MLKRTIITIAKNLLILTLILILAILTKGNTDSSKENCMYDI